MAYEIRAIEKSLMSTKIYQWYVIWLRQEVPDVLLQIGCLVGER